MAGVRTAEFTVQSYNADTGLYVVLGNVSTDPRRPWPTVRAFHKEELWPASVISSMGDTIR